MKRLGHVPALDGVRGIAILMVLVHHLHRPIASGGDIGVDLFFILSGFLITKLMIEERDRTGRIDLKAFYVRRAFRIVPALVVACLGAIATAYLWRPDVRPFVWTEVAFSLGFAGNLRDIFSPDGTYLLGPTWSLGIEEQFYWVWPALLISFPAMFSGDRRTARNLVVSGVALGLVARLGIGYLGGVEKHSLVPFLNSDGLILGAALAFGLHHLSDDHQPHRFFARGGHWVLIALVTIDVYAARWYFDDTLELRNLIARYAFAAIVWWLLTSGRSSRFASLMSQPILRWFGKISYSLYLWHLIVFAAIDLDRLVDVDPIAAKLLALGLSILVSWISYALVEAPAQRFRRALDAARRPRETDRCAYEIADEASTPPRSPQPNRAG